MSLPPIQAGPEPTAGSPSTAGPADPSVPSLPAARPAVFAEREATHLPRLAALFQRLYGHGPEAEAGFARLRAQLHARFAARPAHLLTLDQQRQADPHWYLAADMIGYCAYADRLGGTLAGVTGRIPHLERLGVRYLHLLPFLKARAGDNDGGFAIADFDAIEPRLGSMDDLEHLTNALREAGIALCADFVLNHVADDHAWARAALAGDPHYRGFFRLFPDRSEPDRYEQTVRQIFPVAAPGNFTWRDELQAWVWTTFYPFQWDLNYENPAVFVAVADALLGLANRGIEIFRLDSVGFLWKRPGTDCMNQPETHWIVQALRAVLDIAAPAVVLKAEAIVPTRDLPPYFGLPERPGQECQIAYHSSLMAAAWSALARGDSRILHAVLAETPSLPAGCSWLTYVRCHDDIGWTVLAPTLEALHLPTHSLLAEVARFYTGADGSFADGVAFQTAAGGTGVHGTNGMTAALVGLYRAADTPARQAALRRQLLLYGLALSVGGLPVLYMGDELGQDNDRSPASVALQTVDSRWLQRPPLDLQALAQIDGDGPAAEVFASMCALIAARRRLAALAADRPLRLLSAAHDGALAYLRDEQVLVLSNWTAQPIALASELAAAARQGVWPLAEEGAGGWLDLLSGRTLDHHADLPPWGMVWLQPTGPRTQPSPPDGANAA